MKRVAWLGIIVGLGAVAYFGYIRQLPEPLQEYADKIGGWSGAQEIGKKVKGFQSKLGLPGDAPGHTDEPAGLKPAPRRVELPDAPFVPIALAVERKQTRLLYLQNGKPKSAVFKGLIWWEEDTGVSRIYVEKRSAPMTGPNGEKMKTRRKSHIEQLRRFEYASGETVDLHPARIKGIVLEPEDLTYPDEYKEFFLEENRSVLTVFGSEVVLGVHRATFLGGAHPMETVRTERIELEGGGALEPRFEPERTAAAAAEAVKGKGDGGCVREHQGSVALRGPGGGLLPAAVLGGAYESCRGKLAFSMEKTGVNELVRRGVALGHGAIFRRGQIYVGETPILKSVADVIPLHETPATVAVRGERFPSPVPGAKARKNDLVFKALDRTSKAVSFGRVTPLIGSVALDMDRLDEKDLVHLKQIFDVATVK